MQMGGSSTPSFSTSLFHSLSALSFSTSSSPGSSTNNPPHSPATTLPAWWKGPRRHLPPPLSLRLTPPPLPLLGPTAFPTARAGAADLTAPSPIPSTETQIWTVILPEVRRNLTIIGEEKKDLGDDEL